MKYLLCFLFLTLNLYGEDLEWNRYSTDNFVVLSIDNSQGKNLSENLDKYKKNYLTKWGFPDFKFSKECRVFCVPSEAMLKKLFNITESKVEYRKELNVAWIVFGDYSAISEIVYKEFEEKYKTELPFWFKRGSYLLNKSDVRKQLKDCNGKFSAEKLLNMKKDEYDKNEDKKILDQQFVCLCLMLRKEFGEVKLQGFLRFSSSNDVKDVLSFVYGFVSYQAFDKQYQRFVKDLNSELINNNVPDSYLEIKSKE